MRVILKALGFNGMEIIFNRAEIAECLPYFLIRPKSEDPLTDTADDQISSSLLDALANLTSPSDFASN